jgi:AraC-like DNA-binding protein
MSAGISATLHRTDTLEAHQASIERVIGYMRTHLEEPLDLDQFAQVAGISKFHFVKVFEETTGTTPYHFLACLRIQRAKERLLHSKASITDICVEVGYTSLGSFSQTFSELVGVSPKEFRAMPTRLTLLEFTKAVKRWIAGYRTSAGPQVEGLIEAPAKPRGFIFVGTFTRGVPQGIPASGTVLLRPGRFRIQKPSTPDFHLLAALIPFTANLTEVVANLPVGLVASQRSEVLVPGLDKIRLRLRPMRTTDPPILVALPALLR